MNEMTEAGAKAKGGKGKGKAAKEGGEGTEPSVEGEVGRMLVRAIWAQEWVAANPDHKPEDRKAAWKEQRTAAMEKNLKSYRRALGSLKRSGVVMSITPAPEAAGDDEDADDA